MLRRMTEVNAQADFVDRAGAEQQLTTALIQLPQRGNLTEKALRQLTHAIRLLDINAETALDVV